MGREQRNLNSQTPKPSVTQAAPHVAIMHLHHHARAAVKAAMTDAKEMPPADDAGPRACVGCDDASDNASAATSNCRQGQRWPSVTLTVTCFATLVLLALALSPVSAADALDSDSLSALERALRIRVNANDLDGDGVPNE